MNVKSIDEAIVKFSTIRLQNLGEKESGLYGYYSGRIKNGSIFSNDDIFIMNYLLENYKDKSIHEIASGASQCSHYLSLMGIKDTSASELDERRYKYAMDLGKELGSKCKIIKKRFQEINFDRYNVIFTVNAAGSMTNFREDILLFKKFFESGGKLIVMPDLYSVDKQRNKGIIKEIIDLNAIPYKTVANFYELG